MADYTMTLHKTCQQWRKILVRHSTRDTRGEQWVTRTCDLPLFDDEEKRRGRCRQCISGWTHPESYPVEAPEPDRAQGERDGPAQMGALGDFKGAVR